MKSLEQVLCERDGISLEQARADIAACREEMLEAIEAGDFNLAEEIFFVWFGLESDYMMDIL